MSVRCLIVDDNPTFLQTAGKVLQSGGIAVVGTASSTAEALLRAKETNPDVVLVDIMLGTESGFDLARLLKEETGSDATVILVSTYAEEDFADLIAASPADAFLPKWKLSVTAIEKLLVRGEEKNRA